MKNRCLKRVGCAQAVGLMAGMTLSGAALAEEPFKLVYDLRVRDTGAKTVEVSKLGDMVELDLFATVIGADADPTNEGLVIGLGFFTSSTGGLLGDLLVPANVAPFNAIGSTTGAQRDHDGDGDLDVVKPVSAGSNIVFAYRASPAQFGMPASGFHVGQVRFTLTGLTGDSTEINWTAVAFQATGHLPVIDGFSRLLNVQRLGEIGVGAPVVISLSEPPPPPTDVQYLSGTIDTVVVVDRMTNPTPGGTLILAKGIDVRSSGTFDTRTETGEFGPHQVRVEDATSGNHGGSMFAGTLVVGSAGDGVFTQAAGFTRVQSLTVGAASGRNGTLRQTGGSLQADTVTVAAAGGTGLVHLSNGTTTISSLEIGKDVGAIGVLEVDGSAELTVSTLRAGGDGRAVYRHKNGVTNAGTMFIGSAGSGDPAAMEVSGGTVSMTAGRIGQQGRGQVVQTGGLMAGSSISIHNDHSPSGIFDGYDLSGGTLDVGVVFVHGPSALRQSGGVISSSTMHVRSGARAVSFELSGGRVELDSLTVGFGNAPAEGIWRQTGGDATTAELIIFAKGRLEITGGTFVVTEGATMESRFGSTGTIDFKDSAVTMQVGPGALANFTKGQFINSSNATLTGAAGSLMMVPAGSDPLAVFGSLTSEGLVQVAGQPLTVPANQSIGGSGTITGDVTNEGTVAPGNSPGTLAVEGTYTQTGSGNLLIELSGTATDLFDLLSATEQVTLDGELEVRLLDGFVPASSDTFTILTGASIAGRFDNALERVQFDVGTFDIVYGANSVSLTHFTPVPEPAVGLLCGLAGLALMRRRRQH